MAAAEADTTASAHGHTHFDSLRPLLLCPLASSHPSADLHSSLQLELSRLGAGYVPPGRLKAHVYIMSYDVFRLNQACRGSRGLTAASSPQKGAQGGR